MGVKIITDSTSYIPKEYEEKYNIKVVSLNVVMNNESRREVDIDNLKFYEEMAECLEIPTSSQPIPAEMIEAFTDVVKDGDEVIGIFLSSKMSGTYSSANLAKEMVLEEYPNASINIFDSTTNCMQMGFIVLEAAKAAYEGKSVEEILLVADFVRKNSRFLFTPETLEYLKKGGRIGGAAALFGNILQIKPILTVEAGETSVSKKVRTRKKALDELINEVLQDIKEHGLGDIIVHHINAEKDGLELAKALEEKLNVKVKIQSIGPVIGLHVGPGSLGIAYYTLHK